jgi:type IV pilus assembly protein PilE
VPTRDRKNVQAGVTLIELVIVIAVLALLVSVAVPSYRQYVLRANRAEAIKELLSAAVCQERIYSRTNAYDANECQSTTPSGFYTITVTTQNVGQGVTVTATPQGSQAADSCGALTINQAGTRTAGADVAKCWAGKAGSN